MKKLRFSLFSKIIFWFFLNLLIISGILLFIFNLDFRFSPRSPLFQSNNRIEAVSRLISNEFADASREERDQILAKYSEAYNVRFYVFDKTGNQIAGQFEQLPAEVSERMQNFQVSFPDSPFARRSGERRRAQNPPNRGLPPPPRERISFFVKTDEPNLYWSGSPILIFDKDQPDAKVAILLTASDSRNGRGLFFDPTPWLLIIGVVTLVSIIFWLPFVRGITKAVSGMTEAAEQIAEEDFAVRVNEKRTDELGRLGTAINRMTLRLSVFVHGQKRFLGDVSHELNSPLARLQVALSVLDDYANEKTAPYLASAREDVELMAKLVNELLTYSKAGIKTPDAKLSPVELKPLIERVAARETNGSDAQIEIETEENLSVLAQPEMLARALANIIRNAVRYAGHAGKITVEAKSEGDKVNLIVADNGAGIPEESLERIFEPFYRIEADRSRATGGTGLGLAIVKTCVEACQGKVTARNREPSGLEIIITLKKA
jgi:two-component system sensor histidine kinase CpxA